MNEKNTTCNAHSGLESKLENLVKGQERIEQNMNIWHEHINTEIIEIKNDIKRVPVLWEVGQTTRTMVYGAYTAIAGVVGYLIYHIGGTK